MTRWPVPTISPAAHDVFAAVEARGAHAHQHLAGAGYGLRHFAHLELRAAAFGPDEISFHGKSEPVPD
jgi:hypothetical protein